MNSNGEGDRPESRAGTPLSASDPFDSTERKTMCHHRELEYERLYEDAEARDELPDWANESDEDESEESETGERPIAPSVADD